VGRIHPESSSSIPESSNDSTFLKPRSEAGGRARPAAGDTCDDPHKKPCMTGVCSRVPGVAPSNQVFRVRTEFRLKSEC